jgi:hypothetical protein
VASRPTLRAAVVVLVALVLVGAIAPSASAAGAPPDGEAKEANLLFPSPTNYRNVLALHLFPAKGVAVVETYEGSRNGGFEGAVSYAIAIPPAPLDGSLDLSFPGLGSIVGTVTPDKPWTSAARAKLCRSDYPTEGATFEGQLDFRGAGGYGRWHATKSLVEVVLACGTEPEKENGSHALFVHVIEPGPVLNGPAPIRLFAQGEVRHRVIEFIAWRPLQTASSSSRSTANGSLAKSRPSGGSRRETRR